jgi:hypothetical protein
MRRIGTGRDGAKLILSRTKDGGEGGTDDRGSAAGSLGTLSSVPGFWILGKSCDYCVFLN